MGALGIPGVINNFNLYNNGTALVGLTGEISLPDFEGMTETLSGPGILGEIEEVIIGQFGSMELEIPFRILDEDAFKLMSPATSLNLTLRQGVACIWDTEAGLFMPDFDVTIVYEGNIETQEWLYYEQDGMVVTLGNWLNGRLSCEQIEQLWCELIIPENNDNSEV